MKKTAQVNKLQSGVNISFSQGVEKIKVFQMVERCQTGQCDCMSDETKNKIEKITLNDGEDISIQIDGSAIELQEIEAALKNSPLLKES
ncbi:MAG: hypothetical protein DRG24_01590 [Epsilonproteobacteria bacterium]|nr:MAG: hypothetical protein DRG24_01590 [Campylobacterota bacterium]